MPGGQGLEQEGGGRGKQQPGADSGLEVNIIPPSFFGRGMILMGVGYGLGGIGGGWFL